MNLNDYGLTSENVEKLGQQFSLSSNAPMLFSAAIANVDSDLVDEILNQLGLIISELLDGSPDFSEIIPDTLRLLDVSTHFNNVTVCLKQTMQNCELMHFEICSH